MPTYLWTARDPSGRQVVERVTAATAGEAKLQLLNRGFSEPVLKSDEFAQFGKEQAHNESQVQVPLTPAQELRYQESKWAPILDTLWQSKGVLLLAGALLGWGIWRGHTVTMVIGGAGLLLMPALQLWFGLPSRYYSRLNRAKVAHRWEDVLRLVERLKAIQQLTKIGPGEVELSRCRCQALGALGRLDEAVGEFIRCENHPAVPRCLFFSHLADICDSGKAHDRAIEFSRKATEEMPDSATLWLDYAFRLARHKKDTAAARAALTRVERGELVDLGKPWLPFVRGLIALGENDFVAAKPLFEEALRGFLARRQHDLIHSMILLAKSYLCWVNGQLGNTAEARKLFAETDAWLISGREEELLANCRRVLGRV